MQIPDVMTYDAVQPAAHYRKILSDNFGRMELATGADPRVHKQIEALIDANFMKTPSETIYNFSKPGSGVHLNIISNPKNSKEKYILASSAEGNVEVIK